MGEQGFKKYIQINLINYSRLLYYKILKKTKVRVNVNHSILFTVFQFVLLRIIWIRSEDKIEIV